MRGRGHTTRHEVDMHPTTADLGPIARDDRLERHRRLVSRAVQAGGRQQSRIVVEAEVRHELRHELIRGEAAETAVVGRDDDMEAPKGRGDASLLAEPAMGEPERAATGSVVVKW